jgi:hypothetical protein
MRPDEVDELRPVWEALRRGTKRGRMRVLAAVCPRSSHTIAEVFRGSDRELYAVWASGGLWSERTLHADRLRVAGGPGGQALDSRGRRVILNPRCRCSDGWSLTHEELLDAVGSGTTRLVVGGRYTRISKALR